MGLLKQGVGAAPPKPVHLTLSKDPVRSVKRGHPWVFQEVRGARGEGQGERGRRECRQEGVGVHWQRVWAQTPRACAPDPVFQEV